MVTDDVLFKDLKEDIITYYREHESVIPASPLVDEHNVPIEELYVLPPLWAYTNSYFEPSKNRHKEDETSGNYEQGKQKITISQLFFSCDVRYRKIYITANAGFRKTSLSQKLTMTWCQSHSPLTSLTEHYDDEELAAMKYFDLLFLLHLRDYQNELKCNLDDLIMIMLSANMSRKSQYTNEFIERILHEKKCLVILDGLDEWSHPGHCPRKPEVPHNNHPGSCTVLTTTRDWKIGTIGLSPKDIDRRVEILMLDVEKRNLLEKNAFEILNKRNLNLSGKTIDDFEKNIKTVPIGDIVYIPYILLQLMCLFFGGIPIGKSKCEIYSNITEFTLKRGLNKKGLPDIHVQSNDNAAIAKCMNKNETCIRYFTLLMKLGKLAFYTLFSEKKESSLTFERRIVTQYMTEQEIEFCLKVGLLCQTKDTSIIAEKFYKVFFQHKSVHEFLSAIYITSEWLNESVKLTILKMCSSLSSTLEMENLFVFVCGMNPEVYTCISGELQKIGDIDRVTRRYSIFVNNDVMKTLNSYQLMQLQCLHESIRNGNKSCPIYLYLMLNSGKYKNIKKLKKNIRCNKCHVKSLLIPHLDENIKAFLDPGVFTYLETLRVEHCDEKPEWLTDILTESVRTLKCLTLSPQDKRISLSDISITALTGLTCLQSLCLEYVHMTHSNIECLYAYISQTTTLTQLKLETINCTHHKFRYDCDVTLDLHRLNELKLLHLDILDMPHSGLKCLYAYISLTTKLTNLKLTYINCLDHYNDCGVILDLHYLNKLKTLHLTCVPCKDLQVNPACLEELKFDTRGRKMTARASAILWQDLRAAPVLSSLTLDSISSCQEMIQTIPTLTQLQYLRLNRIDMGEIIPRVSPTMTKMERVVLYKITMSSAAWRKLFFSFDQLPRSFTVNLSSITMTSQEWRELLFSVCGMQHPVTVELLL